MRQPALVVVSTCFAVLCFAGSASAQDGQAPAKPATAAANSETPTPPVATPAPPAPASADKPQSKDDEDDFRPVAITANPLSLLLGRIGLNVEYLPVKHHGIVPRATTRSAIR